MKPQTRRPTRAVRVGDIAIGGDHPILIQSMTIADTCDTGAVVEEIGELLRAGCPLVRVTVPSGRAAENLPAIRDEMRRRGIRVPLVADIHFTPAAALLAADHCEKVRINPGNYADRKRFDVREYTDAEYRAELERIYDRFRPLVERLKKNGAALRIGTNHGSLSDRILNRYGDTPAGMVESALEFVRICESLGYREIVLSMKSSIPSVMVAANRLLVQRMDAEGMDYPLHIGVTEAGAGLEARVKSAIGIGTLLQEGIGDTIRVSLTEDSVNEIAACRAILEAVERRAEGRAWTIPELPPDRRRATRATAVGSIGYGRLSPPRVEARIPAGDLDAGRAALRATDPRAPTEAAETIVLESRGDLETCARSLAEIRRTAPSAGLVVRLLGCLPAEAEAVLTQTDAYEVPWPGRCFARYDARSTPGRETAPLAVVVTDPGTTRAVARGLDASPKTAGTPVLLELPPEAIDAAVAAGSVLLDGLGDGLLVDASSPPQALPGPDGPIPVSSVGLAYTILQGCRLRLTRAEFIACPSCGRTQFDLQTTTKRIQESTAHLRGVKIAIMGCIVNGPGEMADADFGYVGSAPGKVDLYVGRIRVRQALPAEEACQRLVELIREHGMWIDPPMEGT